MCLVLNGGYDIRVELATGVRNWQEAVSYTAAARLTNREYGGLLALEWRDEGRTLVIEGPQPHATPLEPPVQEEFDTIATLCGR